MNPGFDISRLRLSDHPGAGVHLACACPRSMRCGRRKAAPLRHSVITGWRLGVFRNHPPLQETMDGADIPCRANSGDPCLRTVMCTIMRNYFPWHGGVARFLRSSFFLGCWRWDQRQRRGRPPPLRPSGTPPGDDGASLYLPAVGPPPLRFAESPPPPDLATRPASVCTAVAGGDGRNRRDQRCFRQARCSGPWWRWCCVGTAANDSGRRQPGGVKLTGEIPGNKEVPALLPDDTQRETRPEEILPFFQFPGSGGTAIVVPSGPVSSSPTRLPVSSAVYRER